jgi:hypothetical protein
MPEGWSAERLLAVLGALAAIFGPVAAWRVGKLARQTGRETTAVAGQTAELVAITARLETELQVLSAGQQMWKSMFEAATKKSDQQEAALAEARAAHEECRADVRALRAELARRGLLDG